MASNAITSWFLAAGLLAILLRGWRRTQGTTLRAPLVWTILAVVLLAVLAAVDGPALPGAWRFVVAASVFCPLMAVLGAKRPQDRGWQWVVVSLWLVVAWPAVQTLALGSGIGFELFPVWKLFVTGLLVVGLLNYLPTRCWLTALMTVAGQTLLLGESLGWMDSTPWHLPAALACFVVAALVVWLRPAPTGDVSDSRWLRLRDGFGAFWGLRILQRVNETATLRNWPVRLHWSGFAPLSPDCPDVLTTVQEAEIQQTLDTLLRRFF